MDKHFPGPLAPEDMEEQLSSWGSAPTSLLLDANKPLTFKQVPLLVETRGVPSAHFSAPCDSQPLQEGRGEGWWGEEHQRHEAAPLPSTEEAGGKSTGHRATWALLPSPGSAASATAAIKAHPECCINVRFASDFPCTR